MGPIRDKKTVLAIDDTAANLAMVKSILVPDYTVKAATNGIIALKIATSKPPDLILLDIMMPDMDGYQVCQELKANEITREIPVIFLTAMTNIEDEARGFQMGAVDYIAKPISPPILRARVHTHILLQESRESLKLQNQHLEQKITLRTRQISQLHEATMVAMGALAESRDSETGNHIRRTQHYVKALAQRLSSYHRFRDFLTPEIIELLFQAAPLHDIGKVGVPDHILLKPGKLTDEEFEIMKQHTTYGRDAIAAAESMLDEPDDLLNLSREIAYSHQEYWDGTGYPEGLSGDGIPVSARIMAVADVYDALVSKRVYKPAFSHENSVKIIRDKAGSHFDPDIVNAFLEISTECNEIALRFSDI